MKTNKIIYKPAGSAGEYSPWAANFYNGCTHGCVYCYNDKGITAGTLGGTAVTLKKTLVDEATAFEYFKRDIQKLKTQVISDGGIHFNFVSDPCLPQTVELNWKCIEHALSEGVPCQVLTKRADWINHPAVQNALGYTQLISVGFTLTGCDDMEPGASPNLERVMTMKALHDCGVRTWASIEPIIDPDVSLEMIVQTRGFCDHYKIGVLTGKKNYTSQEIRDLMVNVEALGLGNHVYWKHSLLEFIKK